MKIDKIILYRYRRLSLNSIERLEYTPENNIQVIIGRNMSGKSSLLKELSPLPPELKKEFKDEGYKEIHISRMRKPVFLVKLRDIRKTQLCEKDNVIGKHIDPSRRQNGVAEKLACAEIVFTDRFLYLYFYCAHKTLTPEPI